MRKNTLFERAFFQKSKTSYLLIGLISMYFGVLYWDAFPSQIERFTSADEFINKIPPRHLKRMENVFKGVFFSDNVGYVLAGYKPLSYVSLLTAPVFGRDLSLDSCKCKTLRRAEGYHLWCHYNKGLPSDQVAYVKGKMDEWGYYSYYVFHRKSFEKIVEKYQDDFQKVLGEKCDGNLLIERAFTGDFVEDALLGHEGLLGISLGYGRGNAWLFYENKGKSRERRPANMQFVWEGDIEFNEIEEQSYGTVHNRMLPPCFVADLSTEETKKIKKHYLDARTEVMEKFSHERFFREVVESSFSN